MLIMSRLGSKEYLRLLWRAWKTREKAHKEESSDTDCGEDICRGQEDTSRPGCGCKRWDVTGQEDRGTAREGLGKGATSQHQGHGPGKLPAVKGNAASLQRDSVPVRPVSDGAVCFCLGKPLVYT